ncbi:hypothetical protein CEP54_013330 [Fusarium duplospermum]|uniref:DUF7730 domain-containing protein n=1 Tax=Fusarium duplospermum TaxID=1325734 RepID=A0A428P3E9_9HYPO|nr:hypothetical protein CEP54_013330 [Fusarium duplospermum]
MSPVVFSKVGDQLKSPFFKKFPPEIRKMIYTELFGSRLVHVLFHSSVYLKPEFSYTKEGAPPRRKIPGWAHCVCQQDIEALPHQHSEEDHEWCYLSASIIFTCKYAFEEGMPILYGSNTLSYCPSSAYWSFTDIAGRYIDLITNLNFSLTPNNSHHSPVSGRRRNDTNTILQLRWLAKHEASSLYCQIDIDPEDYVIIELFQKEVLADGARFRFFLPELARKRLEQKLLRDSVENDRVEIHWRSDESYSSTELARLRARNFW